MKFWVVIGAMLTTQVQAHDQWSDGLPVPPSVKAACCGKADAHLLTKEQVHVTNYGYQVEGVSTIVPFNAVLPSPDGEIWAFYSNNVMHCFFYPIPGL